MLVQLLLELLAVAPNLFSELSKIMAEIHSQDPTSTKVASIATAAAVIAQTAADVANTTPPKGDQTGGGG